jgi:osmotically inducible protein OsmC
MKFTRKAKAQWAGTGKDGNGKISMESGVLDKSPYAFNTRFEQEPGTNPEELLGAAHAGCFTMQLSFLLNEAGLTATSLETDAHVTFENGTITLIHLELYGQVPDITSEQFTEIATKAKEVCPVSKVLDTEITLAITLK